VMLRCTVEEVDRGGHDCRSIHLTVLTLGMAEIRSLATSRSCAWFRDAGTVPPRRPPRNSHATVIKHQQREPPPSALLCGHADDIGRSSAAVLFSRGDTRIACLQPHWKDWVFWLRSAKLQLCSIGLKSWKCWGGLPAMRPQFRSRRQLAAARRIESSNGKFASRQRAPFITVKC